DYYVSGPSTAQVHGQSSVDLVVGRWETFTYNQVIDTESYMMRFNTSYLLLDNFRYDDGFAVVPEPSTWAFMITGFGLAGAGLRTDRRARRKLLSAC
ncbi:MAG: PEPxxWA-CTERM sorting domain-containing protein, partial [Phenylobacterium sp.]|nr:PEPxxWA-CTERM sorting domain-containing protein [Phenylobacterium sp.]